MRKIWLSIMLICALAQTALLSRLSVPAWTTALSIIILYITFAAARQYAYLTLQSLVVDMQVKTLAFLKAQADHIDSLQFQLDAWKNYRAQHVQD